jgi:hypothetical protein
MNRLLIAAVVGSVAILNIGYYEALDDGDVETIVFIKKRPTFQMKFYNIHANDGEIRKVEHLTAEERGWIIDYCKYRLGIDTDLKTQDDVEMCRKKCSYGRGRQSHLTTSAIFFPAVDLQRSADYAFTST